MKKEIRLYFNLEKESHKVAYDFLKNKSSASTYVIDKLYEEAENQDNNLNNIIAAKLGLIADAIMKIESFNVNSKSPIINDENIKLDLNDDFDDDY